MPKRSNVFQRVVFLLKQQLSPGVLVTESRMLRDLVTGTKREVDVCLEAEVAGHTVIVAVECRDRKRPADVTWVEEAKARHDRLPTNHLVLVSRSGFTKEAITVAATYGIETIPLITIDEREAEQLLAGATSILGKVVHLNPTKVVCSVRKDDESAVENVVVTSDNLAYDESGVEIGPIKPIVDGLLGSKDVGLFMLKEAGSEHTHFVLESENLLTASGSRVHLMKLDPRHLRRIERIRVTGTCSLDVSELPLERGKLGDVQVAWSHIRLQGRDVLLLASIDGGGAARMSLDIASSDS